MSQIPKDCPKIRFGSNAVIRTANTVFKFICEWHLDSFVNAIFLGAPRKAIHTIAEKIGLARKAVDAHEIIDSIDPAMLKAIPPLKVFTGDCNVAVTDIVINNISGSRRFGIGLQIQDNNHIGPVTIDGVAFLVNLTPKAGQDTRAEGR